MLHPNILKEWIICLHCTHKQDNTITALFNKWTVYSVIKLPYFRYSSYAIIGTRFEPGGGGGHHYGHPSSIIEVSYSTAIGLRQRFRTTVPQNLVLCGISLGILQKNRDHTQDFECREKFRISREISIDVCPGTGNTGVISVCNVLPLVPLLCTGVSTSICLQTTVM
jgi:hypothetical protein